MAVLPSTEGGLIFWSSQCCSYDMAVCWHFSLEVKAGAWVLRFNLRPSAQVLWQGWRVIMHQEYQHCFQVQDRLSTVYKRNPAFQGPNITIVSLPWELENCFYFPSHNWFMRMLGKYSMWSWVCSKDVYLFVLEILFPWQLKFIFKNLQMKVYFG